jgi:hypothetical protein
VEEYPDGTEGQAVEGQDLQVEGDAPGSYQPPDGAGEPGGPRPPIVDDGTTDITQNPEYLKGFDDGFALDEWYWIGFDDSYDTLDYETIYYQGGTIPVVNSPVYDAGYYDGMWYAYNDGYFIAYDYAFTVGFSEGYDLAYYPDYLAFIAQDRHTEYDNGGWVDGYNDGFSEGKYFGGDDYRLGYEYDWIAALDEYRSGVDIYMPELAEGTGEYGDVYLYAYGTDPLGNTKSLSIRTSSTREPLSIRNQAGTTTVGAEKQSSAKGTPNDLRPLNEARKTALSKAPAKSPRTTRDLGIKTTWLQRIEAYY